MAREVFGLCDDGVVCVEAFPLRAAHVGETKLSGEIGIFAKVFFDAAPARIARQIEDGPEDHIDAGGARLRGDRSAGLLGDLRIPRSGEIERRGKDGAGIEAVKAFLDKERGNTEAIVRDHPFLDGVGLLGRGIEVMNATHAEVPPKALRIAGKKDGVHRRVCVVGMFVDDVARAGVHIQLPHLLLEGHAAQEVADARFDRRVRPSVEGRPLRGRRARMDEVSRREAHHADQDCARERRPSGVPALHQSILTGRAW